MKTLTKTLLLASFVALGLGEQCKAQQRLSPGTLTILDLHLKNPNLTFDFMSRATFVVPAAAFAGHPSIRIRAIPELRDDQSYSSDVPGCWKFQSHTFRVRKPKNEDIDIGNIDGEWWKDSDSVVRSGLAVVRIFIETDDPNDQSGRSTNRWEGQDLYMDRTKVREYFAQGNGTQIHIRYPTSTANRTSDSWDPATWFGHALGRFFSPTAQAASPPSQSKSAPSETKPKANLGVTCIKSIRIIRPDDVRIVPLPCGISEPSGPTHPIARPMDSASGAV